MQGFFIPGCSFLSRACEDTLFSVTVVNPKQYYVQPGKTFGL